MSKKNSGYHFELYDEEAEIFEKWANEHRDKKCPPRRNGEQFKFIFIPTNIGVAKRVICNYCGEEKDVTDYFSW